MRGTDVNPLGAGFDWRLRAALDRVAPRDSPPRYQSLTRAARPLRFAPVLLAVALTGILSVTAFAATGSANPVVWTEKATSTIQSVSHLPTNVTTAPQSTRPAATKPATTKGATTPAHAAPKQSPRDETWQRPEPPRRPDQWSRSEPSPSSYGGGGYSGDAYSSDSWSSFGRR